jgi:integrase
LFGVTPAEEFDVLRLRTVRDAMIRLGWSRSFINKQVKRLRMVIRWAVGWKLVSQTLADSLKAVEPLEAGDSEAPESRPRSAVPNDRIQAIRPHLPERYRDMVDLMLLTGCRPGELINLTTGQIDRSGEIWRVALAKHKTAHKGKSRTLFFNTSAQLILRKYLQADPAAKLFPGARGDRFSDAMKIACEEAFGMPAELRSRRRHRLTPAMEAQAKAWHRENSFTPHWLRHTVATKIADEMGTEAAQRLLGHAGRAMTEHYSRAAEKQAIEAVRKLG